MAVGRRNHRITVAEIVVVRDVEAKSRVGFKGTKQLFLISVDDADQQIPDSRPYWLTGTIEDVQVNRGGVRGTRRWRCHTAPFIAIYSLDLTDLRNCGL